MKWVFGYSKLFFLSVRCGQITKDTIAPTKKYNNRNNKRNENVREPDCRYANYNGSVFDLLDTTAALVVPCFISWPPQCCDLSVQLDIMVVLCSSQTKS